MSSYYPPKNYTPKFDTSQFDNQEQQYLNFPVAQGTQTFQNIIVNGTITVPSNPFAYLNSNQTFTGVNSFNNNIIMRSSKYIELLDSTNTIASFVQQISNNLDIHNFGTGSIVLNSPSVDMTIPYTYMGGAEMISGNYFTQYDTTNTYGTTLSQLSTDYIIENQNNSSSIILRNKNATGVSVVHQFAFNRVSLGSLLQMGSGLDIVLQGTGKIDQSLATGQNIFHTMKFNNSTGNKQITLFENSPTSVAGNYTLSVEANVLRYNVPITASHIMSIGSGVSTYTNIITIDTNGLTMNSNKNIVLSGTSILSQTGTGTNTLKSTTFSANNTHSNGGQILQYDNTNAVYTTLSQATTNSYLIENNYNSSSIYLRNKNATGGSVDYIFSYDAMTIPTPLTINNNLIVSSYNLVLKNGTNQSNLFQFGTGLYFWNLNNSGSITQRVKTAGGTDVDAVVVDSTTTTINTTLNCKKNITLPPASGYILPAVSGSSYELGYKLPGSITSLSTTITGGAIYNLGQITIPWGVWLVTAVFSFYVSTNGNITTQNYSLSYSNSTINTDECEQAGGEAMTSNYYKIKRLNTIYNATVSSATLYLTMSITASSGVYQYNGTSSGYCQIYAVRIA